MASFKRKYQIKKSKSKACRNIIKKFQSNWNPYLDKEWLDWNLNYVR